MVHQSNRCQMQVKFSHQVLMDMFQKDSKHFSKLPFAPVISFSKCLIISIRPRNSQSNAADMPQMRNHLLCSLCGWGIICAAKKAPFCVLAWFQTVPSLEYEHQLDEVVAGLCLVTLQAYSGMVCQVGGEGVGVQKWFLRDWNMWFGVIPSCLSQVRKCINWVKS